MHNPLSNGNFKLVDDFGELVEYSGEITFSLYFVPIDK